MVHRPCSSRTARAAASGPAASTCTSRARRARATSRPAARPGARPRCRFGRIVALLLCRFIALSHCRIVALSHCRFGRIAASSLCRIVALSHCRIVALVPLSLCITAHPLRTRVVAKIIGASVSETTMRPDPRRGRRKVCQERRLAAKRGHNHAPRPLAIPTPMNCSWGPRNVHYRDSLSKISPG
jgi:hypothetical protein